MAAHAKPRPEANSWFTPQRFMQVLLVFVVLAPLAEFLHWGALAVFICSAIAIIPLAGLVGDAT